MTQTAPRPAPRDVVEVPRAALRAVLPLLREIGDLKRVRTAGTVGSVRTDGSGVARGDGGTADGDSGGAVRDKEGAADSGPSMAERAFRRAWAHLACGEDPGVVAARVSAAAVAGARLAGIDGPVLRRCGLTAKEALAVLERSVAEHTDRVGPLTSALLRGALPHLAAGPYDGADARRTGEACDGPAPGFAAALCAQPRAGATCPGRPRLMVEPPESHGDHCWAVAVYGVLLAEAFGADPGDVFLLGLAHHLHNAVLPDAGFSGEELLGERLPAVVARLTEEQLAVLPGSLAARLRSLLGLREGAAAPAARAFHAADVLDRVLQVRHHARAAAFTAEQALDELDLVHPCAVSGFHRAVLDAAGAG